jgi:hypothetical protein
MPIDLYETSICNAGNNKPKSPKKRRNSHGAIVDEAIGYLVCSTVGRKLGE